MIPTPPHLNATQAAGNPHRRAGLTLVELVLALAVTAFIGLTVATMLNAVAYGSKTGSEIRDLVPRHRVMAARMADAIRGARQVLDQSDTHVALWVADNNNNDDYDTDEITWIEWEPDAGQVVFTRATESHTGVPINPTPANLASAKSQGEAYNLVFQEVWGRNVSSMTFTVDTAPIATQLVTWRTTLTFDTVTDTQVHAEKVGGSW